MKSHPNTMDRPAWETALDPVFLARILRPFHQPGVTTTTVPKHILSRLERMTAPQSLAGDILGRHGMDMHRFRELTPIIYVAPFPHRSAPSFLHGSRAAQGSPEGQSSPSPKTPTIHALPIVPGRAASNSSSKNTKDSAFSAGLEIGPEHKGPPRKTVPRPASEPESASGPGFANIHGPWTVWPVRREHAKRGIFTPQRALHTTGEAAWLSGNGTDPTTGKVGRYSPSGQAKPGRGVMFPPGQHPNPGHATPKGAMPENHGNLEIPLTAHENGVQRRPVNRPIVRSIPLPLAEGKPASPAWQGTGNVPDIPWKPVVREMSSSRKSDALPHSVLPRVAPHQREPMSNVALRMASPAGPSSTSQRPGAPLSLHTTEPPSRIEWPEVQTRVIDPVEPEQPEPERPDLDAIVEKVQRQLRRRFQIETERRGMQPWP